MGNVFTSESQIMHCILKKEFSFFISLSLSRSRSWIGSNNKKLWKKIMDHKKKSIMYYINVSTSRLDMLLLLGIYQNEDLIQGLGRIRKVFGNISHEQNWKERTRAKKKNMDVFRINIMTGFSLYSSFSFFLPSSRFGSVIFFAFAASLFRNLLFNWIENTVLCSAH